MKNLRIALGADHAGFLAKQELVKTLSEQGHKVIDCGTFSEDSYDYPDAALRVSKAVASGRCDRGILACGTGIGMCIAANKVKGIRAGVCWSAKVAKLSAQHNWTNILCVPSRFLSVDKIKSVTRAWLATPPEKGGRHERRVNKISKIEAKS